ncbi:MAG: hypothetical protein KAX31_03745 [Thermoplasmata archaeon]|nr:hypothetical protein [Thermoplasmata archaeon]
MVVKEAFIRGSRKRFQTTVTDLSGNPQDPDAGTCFVRLEKVGSYDSGSPTPWVLCSSVGTTGQFGADIWLENYLTLGDWVARFRWKLGTVPDVDAFYFTLIRKDKPYDSRRGPVL